MATWCLLPVHMLFRPNLTPDGRVLTLDACCPMLESLLWEDARVFTRLQ